MEENDSTFKNSSLRCATSWILYLTGIGFFVGMAVYDGLLTHSNLGIFMAMVFLGIEIPTTLLGIIQPARQILSTEIVNGTVAKQVREKWDTLVNTLNGRLFWYFLGFPLMIAVFISTGALEIYLDIASVSSEFFLKEIVLMSIISIMGLIILAISEVPDIIVGTSATPAKGKLAMRLKKQIRLAYL